MAVRKNVYTLTDAEWTKFVQAVKALKASGRYDSVYVRGHYDVVNHRTPPPDGGPRNRNGAHRGPSFFPWHREFLRRYERDLQAHANDPELGLPYWDWAADGALADPTTAAIFAANRMGGTGSPVTNGPFAYNAADPNTWRINLETETGTGNIVPPSPARGLIRELANGSATTLPTQSQVDAAIAIAQFDSDPFDASSGRPPNDPSFRNTLEGWVTDRAEPELHNRVHVFVGGDMGPPTSPNDPIFFLHHCFVDKLWADWQAAHSSAEYMPMTGGPAGHNWADPLFPWTTAPNIVRPRDVWNHRALGYTYDTDPSGCSRSLSKLFDP
jgi:tyrosinase